MQEDNLHIHNNDNDNNNCAYHIIQQAIIICQRRFSLSIYPVPESLLPEVFAAIFHAEVSLSLSLSLSLSREAFRV